MAFIDKLGSTLSSASKDGISKAKELRDSAKISIDIKDKEGSIQRLYRELGKAYYLDHKDDAEPIYEQVQAITAVFGEIEALNVNKDAVKGIRRCPECGAQIEDGVKFCPQCGAKCEPEVEKVDAEIVEPEAAAEEENKTE